MKNFMILLVVCSVGCGKKPEEPATPQTPINRIMPSEFGGMSLGSTKEEVAKIVTFGEVGPALFLPPQWQGLIQTLYYAPLENDQFDMLELAFKHERLAGVRFIFKRDHCGEEFFHGVVSALNKKLSCKGTMASPGEYYRGELLKDEYVARYGHCFDDRVKNNPSSYRVHWNYDGACYLSIFVYTNQSMDWVPAGKKVNL